MNDMPFYVMEYCPGPYLYGAGRPPGDTPPAETSAPEICSTHPERGEGGGDACARGVGVAPHHNI